jgi:hypothetical protein
MRVSIKIAATFSMLFSLACATTDFRAYSDMCENLEAQECTNNREEIKNLQIALNADKKLKLNLKTDGKWGENTKLAVVTFQKQYNILPAEGYVGPKTKKALNVIAKNLKLPIVKFVKREKSSNGDYGNFRKNTNLKKSFKVFKDQKLLAKANGRNTKLKVDVSEQRLRLYVNNKVALDSPCTTGAKRKFEPNTKIYRDKHTPTGTYKVREKIANKRSTIFGDLYRHGKKIYHGDRRKYRGSWKGVKYVGASLKHWMRLTSGGIGLHASKYVKRYPGTNGCIRLPYHVAKTVFKKVKNGTKVSIVN